MNLEGLAVSKSETPKGLSPIQVAKNAFRDEVLSLSKAYKAFRSEHVALRAILDAYVAKGKPVNVDFVASAVNSGNLSELAAYFTEAELRRERWTAAQLVAPFLRGALAPVVAE